MLIDSFGPPTSPEAQWLKEQITTVILAGESSSPRSQQSQLGASDLSNPCDRYIAYKLAGVPGHNDADPWPAIVGTGIHWWLEDAIKRRGPQDWMTEHLLPIGDEIISHGDLFIRDLGWVVDHKSAGKDRMNEVTKNGPPEKYVTQVNIYGLGYEAQGYSVSKVALIFYPRAGRLKDIWTWVGDYDPERAFRAIDRVPAISHRLQQLDVLHNPHRWEQIDATPSHDCGYCPFYSATRTAEEGASYDGCPG
jgi:hypothetical protein